MTDQYLIRYNIPDKPIPPDAKIFINGAELTLKQFMKAALSQAKPTADVALREAAQKLVEKLGIVDEASSGVFVLAKVHGMEYDGPNYGEELTKLREVLAAHSTQGENHG